MFSSLKTTCYRMLIEKFGNTKPYHLVRYRTEKIHEQFLEKKISGNTSSNFKVFVSLQVEGSLVIIGYSKGDKRFTGEAKCVRKYSRCNKNYQKLQKEKY